MIIYDTVIRVLMIIFPINRLSSKYICLSSNFYEYHHFWFCQFFGARLELTWSFLSVPLQVRIQRVARARIANINVEARWTEGKRAAGYVGFNGSWRKLLWIWASRSGIYDDPWPISICLNEEHDDKPCLIFISRSSSPPISDPANLTIRGIIPEDGDFHGDKCWWMGRTTVLYSTVL